MFTRNWTPTLVKKQGHTKHSTPTNYLANPCDYKYIQTCIVVHKYSLGNSHVLEVHTENLLM